MVEQRAFPQTLARSLQTPRTKRGCRADESARRPKRRRVAALQTRRTASGPRSQRFAEGQTLDNPDANFAMHPLRTGTDRAPNQQRSVGWHQEIDLTGEVRSCVMAVTRIKILEQRAAIFQRAAQIRNRDAATKPALFDIELQT